MKIQVFDIEKVAIDNEVSKTKYERNLAEPRSTGKSNNAPSQPEI